MKITTNKDGEIESMPWQLQFSNIMCFIGSVGFWLYGATPQWLYNTWRASKDGRFIFPARFSAFTFLVGESAAHVVDRLNQYGISTHIAGLEYDLWPDKKGIGIRFWFYVPRPQAVMADDILRQYESAYVVESPRIGGGYTYGKPWGVKSKPRSWADSITAFLMGAIHGQSSLSYSIGNNKPKKQKRDNVATERKITVRPKTKKGNR